MTKENSKSMDDAQIRELMEEHAKAVRTKDVNGAMSAYAPNILSFDVVNPLQQTGVDACRKRTEEWFASFRGLIGYENRDLRITTGADVAFCHSLNRVNGAKTDGQKIEMWWRATVCFRKLDSTWMITHEHASVPFDAK